MFKNPYLKTLYEKRWTILAWCLAFFVTNIFVIQIFPPMKEAFSEMTANLPPSLEVWFGAEGEIWQSVRGFVNLEVMGQMASIVVVFGIIFSLAVLPSEENSGVLLTQLSKPLSRRKIFLQKYLAIVTAHLALMITFVLSTFLGTALLNETIPILDLIAPAFAVFLLSLSFSSLAYAIATIFASKALAGAIVGGYAIIGYFITSLQGASDILTTLSRLTPFHYYNTPSVLNEGLSLGNVFILLGIIIVPLIVSLPIFSRRDLKTR